MQAVKLNKVEESILSSLPAEMRAAAQQTILARKAERQVVVESNRKEFSIKFNENGNLVIRGLGNRFPLGLRPDSMQILLDNAEAIRAVLATVKKS